MTADLQQAVDFLRSTRAIRERCANILEAVHDGRSNYFRVHHDAVDRAAAIVADLTRARFPTLDIGYHSRWRHFEAGGIDRWGKLRQTMGPAVSVPAQARSEIDLAMVSVLLDAGAGPDWSFHEHEGARALNRSEGLGVASLAAFAAGLFSSRTDEPLRADAPALAALTEQQLADAFQVSPANPLVGVAGRVQLLRRLGAALAAHPELFGAQGRPGGLFDTLTDQGRRKTIAADDILQAVLVGLADIWPSGNQLGGQMLGDCWPHRLAGGSGASAGWVPLHKLSQWLSYSLLEPFERAGVSVSGLDSLTALAEYRNGGLLVDAGVIEPVDRRLRGQALAPSDEVIIEWRALTIALIDPLAVAVRARLGVDAAAMPLARILEGGTWAAGRLLASRLRDGSPPLNIVSDGTVF